MLIVIMMVAAPAATEVQASQIFGMRGGTTRYSGQESYVSAQNPNEYAGPIWSANPNFITNYYAAGFIEAGNMKVWVSSANQWQLHPYFSYLNVSGYGIVSVEFCKKAGGLKSWPSSSTIAVVGTTGSERRRWP